LSYHKKNWCARLQNGTDAPSIGSDPMRLNLACDNSWHFDFMDIILHFTRLTHVSDSCIPAPNLRTKLTSKCKVMLYYWNWAQSTKGTPSWTGCAQVRRNWRNIFVPVVQISFAKQIISWSGQTRFAWKNEITAQSKSTSAPYQNERWW